MKNNEESMNCQKKILVYWQVIITDISKKSIPDEFFNIKDLEYIRKMKEKL